MKIRSTKNKNYKLFKYNLLKLQIYSNMTEKTASSASNFTLEQIETYLKQALKIIFEYHKQHLKILFVGFPVTSKLKQIKLIHFTNHHFITQKSWVSGIFRNRFSILSYLTSLQSENFSEKLKLLLTLKAKPNLIVIFSKKLEASVIDEFYKAGIPILSFNCDFLNSFNITYKIWGNFNFVKRNVKLTYFFLLYSLLKKKPVYKIILPDIDKFLKQDKNKKKTKKYKKSKPLNITKKV